MVQQSIHIISLQNIIVGFNVESLSHKVNIPDIVNIIRQLLSANNQDIISSAKDKNHIHSQGVYRIPMFMRECLIC